MGKKLVIVESPAKCKKIEGYLGDGYKCIASYGHIQGLDRDLGLGCINIQNHFAAIYCHLPEKQQQIQRLINECGRADEVILATDDDREGEAIAWHICKVCGLSIDTTKRILFHEITKPAIQQAIQNPTFININTINAQQSRQILDFIVGFTISPILWEHISRHSKEGLSAGRCQTPALRLVYDNQKNIDNAPGKKVYNTTGYFLKPNLPFTLDFHYAIENDMETFLEESVNYTHLFKCGKDRQVTKNPPSPFTTSVLQQTASSTLHISPKDTMNICQKLYEGGYITYMRTDSKTLSKEFLEKIEPVIKEKYGNEYVRENLQSLSERVQEKPKKGKKKKKEEEKENIQEAHEAIRPTDINRETVPETMHPRERKMYALIWRTTMEACMSPAQYLSITATISAYQDHTYKYSTEKVVFPGWKVVGGYEQTSPDYEYIKTVAQGSTVDYKRVVSKVSMKDLKSHYTEAKLISLLEEQGIGRPSTFSSLLDKIQERGYVKKQNVQGKKINCVDYVLEDDAIEETTSQRDFGNEKGKLVIQPTGFVVIEFLISHFPNLFAYEYTKQMEDRLDKIAKGEEVWQDLCSECYNEIEESSQGLKKDKISIKIDDYHTYMIGKFGPVIKYSPDGDKKNVTFKSVKKDINMNDLKAGKLTLEDIIEEKTFQGRILGEYKGESLVLKKGKYGLYVTWGDNKRSLKTVDVSEDDITYEMVVEELTVKRDINIVREITKEMTIRTGKFGDYIFYKTETMKKPRFKSMKGFKDNYQTCAKKSVVEFFNS